MTAELAMLSPSHLGSMTPWLTSPHFADKVASACIQQFHKLSKQGKPLIHPAKAEWTVLAGVVSVQTCDDGDYTMQVVSLGTGLKCLPFSKMSPNGDLLNDAHAEVVARRGFIKYLLNQLACVIDDEALGIFRFTTDDEREASADEIGYPPVFTRKGQNISYHMYISQSPC
ncbi:hypothetical protein BC937DRAFT_88113 [Endogone sp. FLAS-F59071]|nr:hypothetical protein BC937DRAFT_88113 [Endogone sp. FLAS-F59071]|eukprot:RUS18981.1 hypothetical protein BC937DRAFT_88113 [Endogone sp. FLAS-F59071]